MQLDDVRTRSSHSSAENVNFRQLSQNLRSSPSNMGIWVLFVTPLDVGDTTPTLAYFISTHILVNVLIWIEDIIFVLRHLLSLLNSPTRIIWFRLRRTSKEGAILSQRQKIKDFQETNIFNPKKRIKLSLTTLVLLLRKARVSSMLCKTRAIMDREIAVEPELYSTMVRVFSLIDLDWSIFKAIIVFKNINTNLHRFDPRS